MWTQEVWGPACSFRCGRGLPLTLPTPLGSVWVQAVCGLGRRGHRNLVCADASGLEACPEPCLPFGQLPAPWSTGAGVCGGSIPPSQHMRVHHACRASVVWGIWCHEAIATLGSLSTAAQSLGG